jgi:hypothetical protein
MILNMSGGGNPLNFKVVGGTSAPASPKENTIWVNTDKEITGWVFSPSQPALLTEGMVWLVTSASDEVEFNALKKNSIMVYPLYARQYISGALVNKIAKIYQGSEWKSFIPDLIVVPNATEYGSGKWIKDGVTVNATASQISFVTSVHTYAYKRTYVEIDVTNYKTMEIVGHFSDTSSLSIFLPIPALLSAVTSGIDMVASTIAVINVDVNVGILVAQ